MLRIHVDNTVDIQYGQTNEIPRKNFRLNVNVQF